MIYDKNGIKLSLLKPITVKEDFPKLHLSYPRNKSEYLTVYLMEAYIDFEEYKLRLLSGNFANNERRKHEFVRSGRCSLFLNASEILVKTTILEESILFLWTIIIPFENQSDYIKIMVFSDTIKMIEEVWTPIVASMEFDPEKFIESDGMIPVRKVNWGKNNSTKARHFKYLFSVNFASIAFCDSEIDYESEINFSDEESQKRAYKRGNAVTFFASNGADVKTDFYLNETAPDVLAKTFDHVIEGSIMIDSGKMHVIADIDPSIIISMPKGNYKFRIYMKGLIKGSEKYQIYFWPTEEKEQDNIKVLKQFVVQKSMPMPTAK